MLTDNCHGRVVKVQASQAKGTAEREVAAQIRGEVADTGDRVTVGADKASDTKGFERTRVWLAQCNRRTP